MSAQTPTPKFNRPAYAGLDFIRSAFCPLEFNAMRFCEHPRYADLAGDDALDDLEVSDPLHYPRRFPYTDEHGHKRTGIQMVNALFGLAPADFDLFLGLFTYLKRLEQLPADGCTCLTLDFIARQCGLPATPRHPRPERGPAGEFSAERDCCLHRPAQEQPPRTRLVPGLEAAGTTVRFRGSAA